MCSRERFGYENSLARIAESVRSLEGPMATVADAVELMAGTPALPDSRTLAECLGDLDAILARVSVFRSAVQRLPGDRELTVARLDYMAANIREAIQDGDRAMASWRADS